MSCHSNSMACLVNNRNILLMHIGWSNHVLDHWLRSLLSNLSCSCTSEKTKTCMSIALRLLISSDFRSHVLIFENFLVFHKLFVDEAKDTLPKDKTKNTFEHYNKYKNWAELASFFHCSISWLKWQFLYKFFIGILSLESTPRFIIIFLWMRICLIKLS